MPIFFLISVSLLGNSGDLRLLRCFLEMTLPSTKFEFLMSEINQVMKLINLLNVNHFFEQEICFRS